jgi:serine/threonine-protein kinase SRK2
MAPEVMHNTQGSYNAKAADIWSCGVMLFTMLTGSYPFTLAEPADPGQVPLLVVEMFKRMQRQDFEIKPDLGISAPCQALVRRLLHPDAGQRINMVGVAGWEDVFVLQLPPFAAAAPLVIVAVVVCAWEQDVR